MKTFIRKEIEEITDIPARRIQFYTDSGLVKPVESNPGRGKERRYSEQNLFDFLIIRELSKHQIELSKIKYLFTEHSKSGNILATYDTCKGNNNICLIMYGDGTHITSNIAALDLKNSFKMGGRASIFAINLSMLAGIVKLHT